MKKSVAAIAAGSAALLVLTAPAALASQRPSSGEATHNGALTGAPAQWDGLAWVPGDVQGTVTLEVDQSGVLRPVVMANVDLPSSFTWAADVQVSAISRELGASADPVAAEISIEGETVTLKGLNFTDTDGDNIVEFSVTVGSGNESGVVATTMEPADGSFAVSSQYRTNPDRRNKSQTWVASTPGVITLASAE